MELRDIGRQFENRPGNILDKNYFFKVKWEILFDSNFRKIIIGFFPKVNYIFSGSMYQ